MSTVRKVLLVGTAVTALFPFLWLIATSLKGAEEIFAIPPSVIPDRFVWENYSGLWNAVPLGRYFFNTITVTVSAVVLQIVFSSMAGFALARYRFRGRRLVFLAVIAGFLIPKEVIILPVYASILRLQLADSLFGVILPFAVEGFGIFLMRQAFLAVPREIEEAGIMDGASPFRLWWNVMAPMTKPAMATLAIFTFIGVWGDFLWPLVVLKSPEQFTLQVGLSYLTGTFVDNFRYVAAGAVLTIVPVFAVFVWMQKYFERGIFAGSEK